MPIDENGNYERWQGPERCQNDRDQNINILASRMDEELNDMAGAVDAMLNVQGTKPMAGNLNMGGNSIKNAGPAAGASDAPTAWQVQTGAFNYTEDISTNPNEVKVYLNPALDEQPNSLFLTIKVANTNTGASTIMINTLPAKPIFYGTAEIPQSTLIAGQIYFLAYNKTLDAYQILLSGSSTVPGSLPLFATITVAGLLTGSQASGWLMQGSKAYRSNFVMAYDQLEEEYLAAVNAVETVNDTQFTYKLNPDTKRRFYTLTNYNARFDLIGDSGGFVVDTDGKYFYLPKDVNFIRPTVNMDEIGAFKDDTMRPITGRCGQIGGENKGDLGNGEHSEGALEVEYGGAKNQGNDNNGQGVKAIKLNSAKLGANFDGTETAPKHRLETKYYRVDMPASNGIQDVDAIKKLTAEIAELREDIANLKANTKIVAGDNVVIEDITEGV